MVGMHFQRYYSKTAVVRSRFTDLEKQSLRGRASVFFCFSKVMISPVITDDTDADEGATAYGD